jgi:hypothetical protein
MNNSSIALVVCYFGNLPNYFGLTLKTMAANASIDWILLGDTPEQINCPNNVQRIHMTFPEFLKRIEMAGNTEVKVNSVYDIYNFKITYGLAFADYLSRYDYWGYTDLDILFGDLRKYVPEEILSNFDRIHCRGHLSVLRNSLEVNSAFKLPTPGCIDYKKQFIDQSYGQFDEWKGIHRIMRFHGYRQYHKEVIADIRPSRRYRIDRFETTELPNFNNQIFYWYNGKTYRAYLHSEGGIYDEEVAYIHFQKRSFPAPDPNLLISGGFGIGPSGFFPYNREPLTPEQFSELNSGRWRSPLEILEEFTGRLYKKIKSIYSPES